MMERHGIERDDDDYDDDDSVSDASDDFSAAYDVEETNVNSTTQPGRGVGGGIMDEDVDTAVVFVQEMAVAWDDADEQFDNGKRMLEHAHGPLHCRW